MAKRIIRCNRYDNWRGYEGGRFVREFGNSKTETAEDAAIAWRDAGPRVVNGITVYPVWHDGRIIWVSIPEND